MRIATTCAVYALGASFLSAAAAQAAPPPPASNNAPEAAPRGTPATTSAQTVTEIVVTAQKRSQSINNVGMAITAATGEQLKVQGVNGVAGLTKIDPSFVATNTNYGAPVYSIRGVSYNDFALAATPTVSIYSDEIPYAYPALTKGAGYDLERVEVLKGPQGTLYGQNSTGGAINYISAKPTRSFTAGLEGTYGAFNASNLNGFISGALTDTLAARLAFDIDEGGAWQKSDTRDDRLGRKDIKRARLQLDWTPTDRLSVLVNLNGWTDNSETQAGQVIGFNPSVKTAVPALPQLAAAIASNALAPHDARAADWLAGTHPRNDEIYGQASVRVQYKLTDDLQLTYLGSYETYRQNDLTEPGGINYEFSLLQGGAIHSNSQEVRLNGEAWNRRLIWLLGASYEENLTAENQLQDIAGTTASYGYGSYLAAAHLPVIPFRGSRNVSVDDSQSKAVFGNLEYHPTSNFDVHGGLRFTQTDISHGGCSQDVGGYGVAGLNAEEAALIAKANRQPGVHDVFVPAVANGCSTLGPNLNPTYFQGELDENNVSWRVGADWHPVAGTLLYATVSKGYKAGSFPTLSATSTSQLAPVTQEALLAYELGAKSRLLSNLLEINGDIFYYDYTNKQLEGRLPDPLFTALNVLVNIPKSTEEGAELSLLARPVRGLAVTLQGVYLYSKVDGNTPGYTAFGTPTNFEGQPFPDTPRYSALLDGQYNWDISDAWSAFVGLNARYRSSTPAQIGTYVSPFAPFPSMVIHGYALLGLRAGLLSRDGHWRVQVFGENVTNTFYVSHIERISDTTAQFTGMPATWGLTVAYHY